MNTMPHDFGRVLGIDQERRLGEKSGAIGNQPILPEGAIVVMPVGADEYDGPPPLGFRNLRIMLGQPQQDCDAAGVVAGSFEPTIAMSNDINSFIGGAWQGAPDEIGFLVGGPLDIQPELEMGRRAR